MNALRKALLALVFASATPLVAHADAVLSGDCSASATGVITCVSLRGGGVVVPSSGTLVTSGGLATVATSGSYNDLLNKPTIPSAYALLPLTTTTLGGAKASSRISAAGDGTLDLAQQGATTGQALVWNGSTWAPSTVSSGSTGVSSVNTRTGAVTLSLGDIPGAAPLASPTFTGTVTIPAGASIAGFAPLASPALTGTPTAPTPATSDNSTTLATTAYVKAQGYGTGGSTSLSTTPTSTTGTALDASSANIIPIGTSAPSSCSSVGSIVRNTAPIEQGSAGAKYVVLAFMCLASGSPGTWVPLNVFDGN